MRILIHQWWQDHVGYATVLHKFPTHTHTHTFIWSTPAKVTQAPASKSLLIADKGAHLCVCVSVYMSMWKQYTWTQLIWHILDLSSITPASPLISNHNVSPSRSVFPTFCSAVFVSLCVHALSSETYIFVLFFILSNFFCHHPRFSSSAVSFCRPVSLSHSLCSLLAVIN